MSGPSLAGWCACTIASRSGESAQYVRVASIRSRLEDRDLLKANLGSFYLRAGRARRSGLSDGLARFGVSSSPIRRSLSRTDHRGRFLGAADSIRLRSSEFRAPATRPLFSGRPHSSNLESLRVRIRRECVERHRHEVAADAKDTTAAYHQPVDRLVFRLHQHSRNIAELLAVDAEDGSSLDQIEGRLLETRS
jgi:hypothetical protein